jgi:hypothetical protein
MGGKKRDRGVVHVRDCEGVVSGLLDGITTDTTMKLTAFIKACEDPLQTKMNSLSSKKSS